MPVTAKSNLFRPIATPEGLYIMAHDVDKTFTIAEPLSKFSYVKSDRFGPIRSTTQFKHPNSPFEAFISRYTTCRIPKYNSVKRLYRTNVEFVKMIGRRIGTAVKAFNLKKLLYMETLEDVATYTEHATYKLGITKTFVKREFYDKFNELRGISNADKVLVAKMTCYTQVLHHLFTKYFSWYRPGKNGDDVKSGLFFNFVGTDYSRYESSQHPISRSIELMVWKDIFGELDKKCVVYEDFNNKFRFDLNDSSRKFSIKDNLLKFSVHTLMSRLSGSAITTFGNSLISASLQYSYLRNIYSIDEAFHRVGPCYGDDAGMAKHLIGGFPAFCSDLGFDVKIEYDTCPGEHRYLGKVIDDLGTTTYDANRMISKYFGSVGTHDYHLNVLNKWSAYTVLSKFENAVCYKQHGNPFTLVANYACLIKKCVGKLSRLKSGEADVGYVTPDSYEMNSTFYDVFNKPYIVMKALFIELEILKRELYDEKIVGRFILVKYVEKLVNIVNQHIGPFAKLDTQCNKKGLMYCDGVPLSTGKNYVVNLEHICNLVDDRNRQIGFLISQGFDGLKFVDGDKYFDALVKGLELTGIKHSSYSGHTFKYNKYKNIDGNSVRIKTK